MSTTIQLAGISSGNTPATPVTITAVAGDPKLVSVAVNYTDPSPTADLVLTPAAGAVGSTVITVTVDNSHKVLVRTFAVTITKPVPPPPPPPPPPVVGFYASVSGTTSGDGSIGKPWDLPTALKKQTGKNLMLLGGTYKLPGSSQYKATVQGAQDQYITISPAPGEYAVIDGGFWVGPYAANDPPGNWVIYRDLEVLNSITKRMSAFPGSHPADITMTNGFAVYTDHVKIVNNFIHDAVQGISSQVKAQDTEIYGNVIINNGFVGTDRGHGHATYVQNASGQKVVEDNISGSNFGEFGVQLYGESAPIINVRVVGNVVFNNQMIVGSSVESRDIVLNGNHLYNGKVLLSGAAGKNKSLYFTNNYIAGSFEVGEWDKLDFTDNVIYSPLNYVIIAQNKLTGDRTWNNNHYFVPDSSRMFSLNGSTTSWDAWRAKTGFDQHSTVTVGVPPDQVFIRPNKYQPGRANIIVYNWSKAATVSVDVSSAGLAVGQKYTLRNAQNYLVDVTQGVYDGQPLVIPMTGRTLAIPNGFTTPRYPTTFPQFGVFILEADNG